MNQISPIGIDTSKHIFQLYGVDNAEMPFLRRKLRRKDMIAFFEKLAPTRIAIEACGAEGDLAGERTGGVIDRSPTRVNP